MIDVKRETEEYRQDARATVRRRALRYGAARAHIRFCETNPIYFCALFYVSQLFTATCDVYSGLCKWVHFRKTNPFSRGVLGGYGTPELHFAHLLGGSLRPLIP